PICRPPSPSTEPRHSPSCARGRPTADRRMLSAPAPMVTAVTAVTAEAFMVVAEVVASEGVGSGTTWCGRGWWGTPVRLTVSRGCTRSPPGRLPKLTVSHADGLPRSNGLVEN
ncbi:unnamed protein product, partial [Ectocarpus sp. 12 AP-2014]